MTGQLARRPGPEAPRSNALAASKYHPMAGGEVCERARQNREHVRYQIVNAQPPHQHPHDYDVAPDRQRPSRQVEAHGRRRDRGAESS